MFFSFGIHPVYLLRVPKPLDLPPSTGTPGADRTESGPRRRAMKRWVPSARFRDGVGRADNPFPKVRGPT